jgi:hypothetical protein
MQKLFLQNKFQKGSLYNWGCREGDRIFVIKPCKGLKRLIKVFFGEPFLLKFFAEL